MTRPSFSSRTITSPCCRNAQGAPSRSHRRPVLAHPLAQPRSLPRLPRSGRSLEGFWGTICWGSTSVTTARTSWRPSTASSRSASTRERSPSSRGDGDAGPAVPDQHRFRKVEEGPDRGHRAADRPSTADFRFRDRFLGVGIDRMDYTKGIVERFNAVDRFLEKYPEYVGKFVFLQLGPLSRIHIPDTGVQRRNLSRDGRYQRKVEARKDWQPILLHKTHLSLDESSAITGRPTSASSAPSTTG